MTRSMLMSEVLDEWLLYGALAWLSFLLLLGAFGWWRVRRRRLRNRERRRATRLRARRSGR